MFEYGSWQNSYQRSTNEGTLSLLPSAGTDPSRTTAEITLATSRYPQLEKILKDILANSIYGGTEVNAAKLIAASIMVEHGQELGFAVDRTAIDKAVKESITQLNTSKDASGVWQRENKFDPSATRFVIEALAAAQHAGLAIDQQLLSAAFSYFRAWQPNSWQDRVEQQYVFSLFPNETVKREKIDLTKASSNPSFVARAAIANYRQKFINSTREEQALLAEAKENETQMAWIYGTAPNGSAPNWNDISLPTSWSTRALLEMNLHTDKAVKALDYLYRNPESYIISEQQVVQALSTIL